MSPSCRRGQKNYNVGRNICTHCAADVYVCTCSYTWYSGWCGCEHVRQTRSRRLVWVHLSCAIFTQANRAVIPRAYPSSPSHTSAAFRWVNHGGNLTSSPDRTLCTHRRRKCKGRLSIHSQVLWQSTMPTANSRIPRLNFSRHSRRDGDGHARP